MTAPLVQSRFRVTGMDCASCAAKIEGTTLRIAGVAEAEVSVVAGTLVVRHTPDADLAPLSGRLSPMGYAISPRRTRRKPRHRARPRGRSRRRR